jgi:hypothetical protein
VFDHLKDADSTDGVVEDDGSEIRQERGDNDNLHQPSLATDSILPQKYQTEDSQNEIEQAKQSEESRKIIHGCCGTLRELINAAREGVEENVWFQKSENAIGNEAQIGNRIDDEEKARSHLSPSQKNSKPVSRHASRRQPKMLDKRAREASQPTYLFISRTPAIHSEDKSDHHNHG